MNNGIKITGIVIVLLFSTGYLYSTWAQNKNGLRDQLEDSRPRGEFGPRGDRERPRGERPNPQQMQERMAQELGLSDEQQKKIDDIRKKYMPADGQPPAEGERPRFREMMEEMQEVLTPEQREKAQSMMQRGGDRMRQMMQQREDEARKTLSPEDFERWKEKQEEMRQRFMQRGGRGGGEGRRGGGEGGQRPAGDQQQGGTRGGSQ
jgi:hypothetical protein